MSFSMVQLSPQCRFPIYLINIVSDVLSVLSQMIVYNHCIGLFLVCFILSLVSRYQLVNRVMLSTGNRQPGLEGVTGNERLIAICTDRLWYGLYLCILSLQASMPMIEAR